MRKWILVINPGSTSTKIGLYDGTEKIKTDNIVHAAQELGRHQSIIGQMEFRLAKIKEFVAKQNIMLQDLAAIVARGGLLKPIPGGTYLVNAAMLQDLRECKYGAHASNLGAILADSLAQESGCAAYIVDPVVVDELEPIARITGRPEIERRSVFHALNQKAVAKRFAQTIQRPYEELTLIVCHMGGGISVGCHYRGRVVEVNNALDGAGPFSPERAGTMPAGQFADFVREHNLESDSVGKMLAGQGGLVAHLGTNDGREVEQRIRAGDKEAELVYDAMIYNIARDIAAAAVPAKGGVDYILLTGGIAYSKYVTEKLREYVSFVAPVYILPGEDELQALAEGASRVLEGEEVALEYC